MSSESKDFTTTEELSSYLKSRGINLGSWGTGGTKTVEHLVREMLSSECTLKEVEGRLVRYVTGVGINVFYKEGETILRLKEDRQDFANGQVRHRNIATSLGEKMFLNEKPEEAAVRAFEEELKIVSEYDFENTEVENRAPTPSEAYPGLITKHLVYLFDVSLKDQDYRPEGYQEVQPDKTTYFVWHKI